MKSRGPSTKPRAKGQRGKSIEEVVSYALGHRIRIEILALLNEGVYTPDEISDVLGEPIGKVTHHITELADGGAIELARTEPVRNATRHFYRAVEQPYVSEAEAAAMTPQQRQIIVGLILQSIMAESMSAFWAGNMINEPSNTLLAWRWFNVDKGGPSGNHGRVGGVMGTHPGDRGPLRRASRKVQGGRGFGDRCHARVPEEPFLPAPSRSSGES